jgi:hypothetical protein
MLTTPSFWSFILQVIILIVTVAGFVKIMKNDLHHLGIDLKEIKDVLTKHGDKIDNVVERVSCMEGIMGVNAKRLRRSKKR